MHTTSQERSALLALHAAAQAPDPADEPVSADELQVQVGNQMIPWAEFWALVDGDTAEPAAAPAPQPPARGAQ